MVLLFSGCLNTSVAVIDGEQDVNIQDYTGEIQNYFLTTHLHNTTFTSNGVQGINTINVASTTDCVDFDAIDIYDNESYFQGIIQSVTANTITFTPGLDKEYDLSNSVVKCGEWDMSTIDGSTNPTEFYITPPTDVKWHLESSVFNILDNSAMDDGMFGSRSALTNGFVVSRVDGYTKELFLIYNNAGFKLRGFNREYAEKAPAGDYSYFADIQYNEKFGAVVELDGRTNDKYIVLIQDDMTSQEQMAYTVAGHRTTD